MGMIPINLNSFMRGNESRLQSFTIVIRGANNCISIINLDNFAVPSRLVIGFNIEEDNTTKLGFSFNYDVY